MIFFSYYEESFQVNLSIYNILNSNEENKYWFTEIFRCVSNVRKLKFSFKYGDPSNKLDAVRCRHDPMQTCEQCLTVSDSAAI